MYLFEKKTYRCIIGFGFCRYGLAILDVRSPELKTKIDCVIIINVF